MQRGYCAVSTRYSPALIREQALSSPKAFLQVCVLSPWLPLLASLLHLQGETFLHETCIELPMCLLIGCLCVWESTEGCSFCRWCSEQWRWQPGWDCSLGVFFWTELQATQKTKTESDTEPLSSGEAPAEQRLARFYCCRHFHELCTWRKEHHISRYCSI